MHAHAFSVFSKSYDIWSFLIDMLTASQH